MAVGDFDSLIACPLMQLIPLSHAVNQAKEIAPLYPES